MERLKQLKAAFTMTRKSDPQLPLWMGGGYLVAFAFFFVLGAVLVGSLILGLILGFLAGPVAAIIVFGRRAMKTQYAMLEGQPGAAIAVLQSQRGFLVTPAIAFNKRQDMIHLAVGRAGVILIGEGRPQGVKLLMKQEKVKIRRATGDVKIHEMSVGNEEGQIPLGDLRGAAMKLKPTMKKGEMYDLHQKLDAIAKKFQPKMPGGPTQMKRPKLR
jgi:hypothetical protein